MIRSHDYEPSTLPVTVTMHKTLLFTQSGITSHSKKQKVCPGCLFFINYLLMLFIILIYGGEENDLALQTSVLMNLL